MRQPGRGQIYANTGQAVQLCARSPNDRSVRSEISITWAEVTDRLIARNAEQIAAHDGDRDAYSGFCG